MSAATIINKCLERYAVKYTGKTDHTHQCTALALLISRKKKSEGKDILGEQPSSVSES